MLNSERENERKIATAFFLPGILVFLVLGSIFLGIASPTEAAEIGALGAIGLAALRKKPEHGKS